MGGDAGQRPVSPISALGFMFLRPTCVLWHGLSGGAGQGPDHEVHDFPSSELGLKLGGFMVLSSANRQPMRSMDDLDLLGY